jgi:SiaC family regulatory phosphoprotein
MENLNISKTESTPEIRLDYANGLIELKGESYPENTAEFYAPIFEWLRNYFDGSNARLTTVNMEIIYFNSSSSKALMNFFDLLENASEAGKKIIVNWIYDADNENSLEYGEEFKEDIESFEFNLVQNND